MDNLDTKNEDEKPEFCLNFLCLVTPIAAYLLFMNIGGRLLGLGILGLWSLYIWAIPIVGFWALILSLLERKSRQNKAAAFYFFLGHCLLALYINRDLMNSP